MWVVKDSTTAPMILAARYPRLISRGPSPARTYALRTDKAGETLLKKGVLLRVLKDTRLKLSLDHSPVTARTPYNESPGYRDE